MNRFGQSLYRCILRTCVVRILYVILTCMCVRVWDNVLSPLLLCKPGASLACLLLGCWLTQEVPSYLDTTFDSDIELAVSCTTTIHKSTFTCYLFCISFACD